MPSRVTNSWTTARSVAGDRFVCGIRIELVYCTAYSRPFPRQVVGGLNAGSATHFLKKRWPVRFFTCDGVKELPFGQRLFTRNFSSAEGRGDSNVIASPETGCSKPSDLACNAIRLRIHRGCIACLVL